MDLAMESSSHGRNLNVHVVVTFLNDSLMHRRIMVPAEK